MGRKSKYKPSKTKTSAAQKKAIETYREKNKGKYKSVSITIETEQMEADKKRIAAAGYSLPQFWRVSVDRLPDPPAEPIPADAEQNAPAPVEDETTDSGEE